MTHRVIRQEVRPCLWMSAGLLAYRLCDRDFDCDHCPLDAALRGHPLQPALQLPDRRSRDFPADRDYTPGHGWLQAVEGRHGRRLRFGLDSFAAALIGHCVRVACSRSQQRLAQGDTLCQIDLGLGVLWITTPISGVQIAGNPSLQDRPNHIVSSPYTEGWIAELIPGDASESVELFPHDTAREKAQLDLQRFRRQLALQFLAEEGAPHRPTAGRRRRVAHRPTTDVGWIEVPGPAARDHPLMKQSAD